MIEKEILKRFYGLRSHYEQLYETLKEERQYLPKGNLDKLQTIVHQIEQDVETINQEREDLVVCLKKFTGNKSPSMEIENLMRFISPMYHQEFYEVYEDVTQLIDDVKRFGKENRFIIEDGLNFIEETMQTVVGVQEKNTTYDKEMKIRKRKPNNLIFSKEV